MLIAALLLALLGAGLFVGVHFQRKRLATLIVAAARKVGELSQTAGSVGKEIGGGGFRELVEIVGDLRCDRPLTSPLGGEQCVSYSMSVVREYEEDYEERDSKGNVRRGTRRGSDTVHSDSQRCDFQVDDGTGRIDVESGPADLDGMVQTVSRFENDRGGAVISLGSFSLNVTLGGGRRRTLGYRYTESVFPLARRVTVIGEVSDAGGSLRVRKGAETSLIVSTRTRQELRGSTETTTKILGVCGTLSLLAALVTGVMGALGR